MIPKTTTIGSYPTFPKPEDIEYYLTISSHGLGDEVIDPYLWSIDEALEDFTSAGIEVPSTGQSRGDLYSLFLDPKFVKGIRWNGAEAFVDDIGGLLRRLFDDAANIARPRLDVKIMRLASALIDEVARQVEMLAGDW